MKKFRITWVILGVVLVLVSGLFPACQAEAPRVAEEQESFVLRYASQWPALTPGALGFFPYVEQPVLDEIEMRTEGRITFDVYAGGVLGGGAEIYDVVRTGKADVGTTVIQYTPGRFPLSDLLTVPGWGGSDYEFFDVNQATYDRILYKEFPDVKMLAFGRGSEPFYLQTNKEIKTLEDFKGLKIRTGGGIGSTMVEALGAEPIIMPVPDVYLALQTGVIDGLLAGSSGLLPFKMWEVYKYELRSFQWPGLVNIFMMNLDTWNKLPNELRQIIELVYRHQSHKLGVELHWANVDVLDAALNERYGANNWLLTLPDDDQRQLLETSSQVVINVIADMEAEGLAAQEVIDIIREEAHKRNVDFPY
ncbi:MAG: TRAP transporter substrate-binding protein DctP [Dehalococcoidia bacterium]